tara:strand:+ start:362 stop:1099 length:738 start_codon:yes stop_codon:yes gene_type:complete
MSYYVNKLNQKIAYKYYRGGSPGIIFVHGLNSDMEGLKAKSIEKYAKKNKLSFLRFDCRGHGKSHGNFEDFTISDWKNDLIDMIDKITSGPQIIIGSSMGGWLMLLAAKLRKKRIFGLIGLAAAPDFGDELYSSLNKKSKKEINQKGKVKYYWNDKSSYILTKNFFIDAKKNKILNKPIHFNKPIILFHGSKDEVVKIDVSQKILNHIKGNNIQINFLKSSDHSLSSERDIKSILSAIDLIKKKI